MRISGKIADVCQVIFDQSLLSGPFGVARSQYRGKHFREQRQNVKTEGHGRQASRQRGQKDLNSDLHLLTPKLFRIMQWPLPSSPQERRARAWGCPDWAPPPACDSTPPS